MEFLGYERPDGSVGIRNHVVVMTSGLCVNEIIMRITNRVEGALPILHRHACVYLQNDRERAFRTLVGIGRNPNVAAALIVGIGCEGIPVEKIADGIAESQKPVEAITIQKIGDFRKTIDRGIEITREMSRNAFSLRKKTFDSSNLCVAVKCGGSDATSGISSNPAVGNAMDMIIEDGGTVILSETTELMGAEHILERRTTDDGVRRRIYEIVGRMDDRISAEGVDIRGSEPTPANIRGGLTTIEEKSLGAIIKGGLSQIQGVLEYGEIPKGKGVFIMDSTANTPELLMGFASAGAQILIFSMGGGLPARLPVLPAYSGRPIIPVIKVLGNPIGHEEVRDHFDVYAGTIIEGKESIEEVSKQIYKKIIEAASGKKTRTETTDYIEPLNIYTTGPML